MAGTIINNPVVQFFDNNGNPLTGGKITTYLSNTTTPAATWQNEALSTLNTNPIILNSRGEATIWLTPDIQYTFVLTDANDNLIQTVNDIYGSFQVSNGMSASNVSYTFPDDTVGNVQQLSGDNGADGIGYLSPGDNAVLTTVGQKLSEYASVFDYMTPEQIADVQSGSPVLDVTTPASNAIATGKKVRFPAGIYLMNLVVDNKTILVGDGSTETIFKPFDVAQAAVTYRAASPFWTYHSTVDSIGFEGIGTKTGVGFTFGATTQAGFYAGAQFANNVKFKSCRFSNLEKGVQFPFGNIGSEFYSCGFTGNKYGVYSLGNKQGGDIMHGGNKYFYAGEFNTNDCAFYLHDVTQGFGGISFKDTIFEFNLMAGYIYTPSCFTPVKWIDCWFEGNGQLSTGAATVTVDQWSGATRSDLVLVKKTLILDGNAIASKYVFDGGFVTDVRLRGENIQVIAKSSRTEYLAGFSGGLIEVDNPLGASFRFTECTTEGGAPRSNNVIVEDYVTSTRPTIGVDNNDANSRLFITKQRNSKVASYGPSRVMSASLTTAATTGNGSFTLSGSVVSDGQIYASCNEFTRAAFASSEFTALNSPDSEILTSVGWYVFTLDFKRTLGNPSVYIWDRANSRLILQAEAPTLNKWYTFAGIGYSAGVQTLYLDFSGSNEDCTWRVSAYQIHRFDTRQEAELFLQVGAFAES